ncbi:putative ribonuclease H-like domain-containing protein [Tanacetum coccineum]
MSGTQGENPPPPPPQETQQTPTQQTPHTVSTIKLPILKKGEYDIWAMKIEHYLAHTDYPIWEVIQNGNGPVSVTTDTTGQIKILPPKTGEEIVARERERKARTTLLMAIPEDHLAKFHKMTDAKDITVENASNPVFDGSPKGYEEFQVSSQLEIPGAVFIYEDANQNFLRTLLLLGHFARECRTKEDNRRRDGWNSGNKDGSRTGKKEESKAMVTVDGESVDWTTHSGDDENYAFMASNSSGSVTQVEVQPKVWSDANIIEEYESDSDDEYVSVQTKGLDTPSFANKQVKTPRENVKNQSTQSQKPKVNNKELGHGFTERACFVCGSFSHLIRDCDYHVKLAKQVELNQQNMSKGNGTRERKPTWNNVQRVNKQNQFVSLAVQTKTGNIPVNTAKASGTNNFSTARQNVNRQTVLTSTVLLLIRNKAYLADFSRTVLGGPVAFGGSKGHITGKGKIKTGDSRGLQQCQNSQNKMELLREKEGTYLKAARTQGLQNHLLLITFWAEAVSTACYVLYRIRLIKLNLHKVPQESNENTAHKDKIGVQERKIQVFLDDSCKTSQNCKKRSLSRKLKLSEESLNNENTMENLVTKAEDASLASTTFLQTNSQEDDNEIPPCEDYSMKMLLMESLHIHLFYYDDGLLWADFTNLENSLESRLVAQGHRQEEGIDYDEVFAPVARLEAIRIFLAFASYMGFIVYQMDVKSAFLYGKIDEEVYVSQPPSFLDPNILRKSIKWLKLCMGYIKLLEHVLRLPVHQPLVKYEEASDVDVHLYRSMIGSLMYVTASRPDIMFAVCACSRFQVTPKTSHLSAVKRIFRYLKGKPKLGLWYPRESSFDLESYSDSDYAGANLDRKSTTGGCQFLGRRLITWQCKKQTIVATSTTEAEYVAAASCCGQVLWIQNQMLDYGFNFMNTKIYIDNESTICISTIAIVKTQYIFPKTKHIAIRHHFIRDAYEKKLIQVLKIHTNDNVADLLTKAFDVSRFQFLVVSIGMINP